MRSGPPIYLYPTLLLNFPRITVSMNERILKSGLRAGYAALIVSAFPAVYFFYFGFATSLFLLAAVLVLVERWTDMREALFQLRGRSDEAIHLTAEIATRFAEQEQKSSILQQREVKF